MSKTFGNVLTKSMDEVMKSFISNYDDLTEQDMGDLKAVVDMLNECVCIIKSKRKMDLWKVVYEEYKEKES